MFVYERNGNICIALEGNLPVNTPAYVIDIDEEAKTISINGAVVEPNIETEEAPGNEPEQEQATEEEVNDDIIVDNVAGETISDDATVEEAAE